MPHHPTEFATAVHITTCVTKDAFRMSQVEIKFIMFYVKLLDTNSKKDENVVKYNM